MIFRYIASVIIYRGASAVKNNIYIYISVSYHIPSINFEQGVLKSEIHSLLLAWVILYLLHRLSLSVVAKANAETTSCN